MSITKTQALCNGCKACEQGCPGSLIKMNEAGKAYIKYPKDCWGCSSCVKECHFGAISLYLGADIGGMGSKMTVDKKGDKLYWQIHRQDGETEQSVLNTKESNKY